MMALIHSFESDGNFLFKYRGQIPVILFILAVPVIFFTPYHDLNHEYKSIMNYSAIGISLMGVFIRAYTVGTTARGTSGRNTKEQVADVLNSSGIYSIVRHPLYLGNYLMWIGIVLFTKNMWFAFSVSLAYWLYYERIMFAEERFLERKFGQAYLDWSLKAPAFIPKFSQFKKSEISFSLKAVLRREYSGWLATVLGFLFVYYLIKYFSSGQQIPSDVMINIFIAAIILTVFLRSLKHYTKVLNESDRS